MRFILFFVALLLSASLGFAQCPLTTPEFPFETQDDFWGQTYSWSAGLYLPTQIGGPTTINSLGFRVNAGSGTYTDVRIYVRHTSISNYASATGYPGHTGFTLVWQGTMSFTGTGVYNYTLTTPYVFNGSNNLEVLFEHRGGQNFYPHEPWFHRTNAAPTGVFPGKVRAGSSWTNAIAGSSNRVFNLALFVNGLSTACNYNLPVELVELEVVCDPQELKLKWTTASEENNSHYEIEYSEFGEKWNKIGEVEGAGNSVDIKTYVFDLSRFNVLKSGYLKLSQVDFDGHREELEVRTIPCSKESIVPFPNPFTSEFIVPGVFYSGEVRVIDMMGRNVLFSSEISRNGLKIKPLVDYKGILFVITNQQGAEQMFKISQF